jgi:hypothetical protein
MEPSTNNGPEHLWKEYSHPFCDMDDLTLGRWLSQTLSQFQDRTWRLSHPLVNSYRIAAKVAHDRQLWLKRLANFPPKLRTADCCRAAAVPVFTRDVAESGLICFHCQETLLPLEELTLEKEIRSWAERYQEAHSVAHREEKEQGSNYSQEFSTAKTTVQRLFREAQEKFFSSLQEDFSILVWEDQDECLQVMPEDIRPD